jgi:hypothetical protein
MSRAEAAGFVYSHCLNGPGWIPNVSDIYTQAQARAQAYKYAAKKLHPDNKETGNHELFVTLQEAMEVLEG